MVIEVRAINRQKTNSHSSARHIANLDLLTARIRALAAARAVPLRITAQNFALLPFKVSCRRPLSLLL